MIEVTVSCKNTMGHRASYTFALPKGFRAADFKFGVFGDVKFLIQSDMPPHFYDADKKAFVAVPTEKQVEVKGD